MERGRRADGVLCERSSLGAARNPDAYVYLAESIRAWPDQPALAARLQAAGWADVAWRDPSGIDILLAPPRVEQAEMVTARDMEIVGAPHAILCGTNADHLAKIRWHNHLCGQAFSTCQPVSGRCPFVFDKDGHASDVHNFLQPANKGIQQWFQSGCG